MDGMDHEAENQTATLLQQKYKFITIGDLDRAVL